MTDETRKSGTPNRANEDVRFIELWQVTSAIAAGLLLLPWLTNDLVDYDVWFVLALTVIAMAGAIRPMLIDTSEDLTRLVARYVITDVRIATLKELQLPPDVILALTTMNTFSGTGLAFKKRFFQVIGEERGAAFLDCLYKYLREEPDSEGTAVKGAASATPSPEVSMGPSMTIAKPATPESEPQPSPA